MRHLGFLRDRITRRTRLSKIAKKAATLSHDLSQSQLPRLKYYYFHFRF
ncbi:MAG: hypothetical protein EA361_18925 [Bacteroidetes bacterium]|nr:MAG: hypothetical protein EA361_18925 [Bacteroidota bacterium]